VLPSSTLPIIVDDAGGVEQPLGQGGLTGVYMRQDAQVERSHDTSCPSGRRKAGLE